MNKRQTPLIIALALALVLSLWPLTALGEEESTGGENILTNSSFEELDASGMPVGWSKDMYIWDDGVSMFDVIEGEAHTGNNCVRIRSYSENDARFIQTVDCKPSTMYRLSGWARVSDVAEDVVGANLSIENAFSSTNVLTGTSADGEWTYLELYGYTGADQTSLTVMVRLGFYGSTVTGTAMFDDISLEEVTEVPADANFGLLYQDTTDIDDTETDTTAASHDHTMLIMLIALAFAVLTAAALICREHGKLPSLAPDGGEQAILSSLLAVAFILRLVLAAVIQGYPNDIACWQGWGSRIMESGTWGFYESGWCDYPPAYMYVLGLLDGLSKLINAQYGSALSLVIVKLPAMLCDLVCAALLYKWLKREKVRGGLAMWVAVFYLFNPATICDSAAWGQIDSVFTLMVVGAVYLCVQGNWIWALPLYIVSALVKPQTLMLAPIALIVLITEIVRAGINRTEVVKKILTGLAISLAAAIVIVVPFWGGQNWNWLIEKYTETLSSYNYATINAMNLYEIFDLNWQDASVMLMGIPTSVLGYIFMAVAIAYSGFMYVKAKDRRVMPLACAILVMILFTFSTKMHERYAFPAIMLLTAAYVLLKDRRLLYSALVMSVTQFINMALVLQSQHLQSSQQAINVFISLMNVAVTIYTCIYAWDICVGGNASVFTGKASQMSAHKPEHDLIDKRTDMIKRLSGKSDYRIGMKKPDWIIVGAITAVYAVIAFTGLGTMSAPQTEWRSSLPGETVTIDLGQERTFDFTYYGGICDSTFTVEFSSDGENWTEPGTADYRQGKIFQWLWYRECVKTEDGTYQALVNGYPKNTARYIRLTFESAGFKMREVGFLDENGECYPIAGITSTGGDAYTADDPNKMIDEQDTVPAEPSYYNSMIFDEIYHARTAYEHLHGLHTYEWTHPPLGKVLMMIGIAIFGMCPFGWRFMGTLMGVLMVPVMYLLTKQLFKRRDLSIFTTVLLTFDFMHFTQTRLATIDSYSVFFIMVMYLFMFRYMQMSFYRDGLKKTLVPLGLSGIFMGIGCATKWICIYAGAGLAILFFATMYMRFNEYCFARKQLKHIKHLNDEAKPYVFARDSFAKYLLATLAFCCVFFVAIPLVIYYLSYYWQLTPDGDFNVQGVINLQKSIFSYHSGLTNDSHPFRAAWYTWPFILKPMYYYSGREFMQSGTLSIIWCMGNPAVWYSMLVGMLFTMILCIKEKLRDRKKLIIIASFLAQYLPWVLVPRSMYIYHYFASIPFMILSLCFAVKHFEKGHPRAVKGVGIALMVLAVGMFVLFYPVISGVPCSQSLVTFLNSLGPWNLY